MNRPGLRVDVMPAVEYESLDPVLREQGRRTDAGRAGTDDHDGNAAVGGHANATAVHWVPRSMAPSSVATDASTTSPLRRYLGFVA